MQAAKRSSSTTAPSRRPAGLAGAARPRRRGVAKPRTPRRAKETGKDTQGCRRTDRAADARRRGPAVKTKPKPSPGADGHRQVQDGASDRAVRGGTRRSRNPSRCQRRWKGRRDADSAAGAPPTAPARSQTQNPRRSPRDGITRRPATLANAAGEMTAAGRPPQSLVAPLRRNTGPAFLKKRWTAEPSYDRLMIPRPARLTAQPSGNDTASPRPRGHQRVGEIGLALRSADREAWCSASGCLCALARRPRRRGGKLSATSTTDGRVPEGYGDHGSPTPSRVQTTWRSLLVSAKARA